MNQNKKELTLEEAKANFKAAVVELDPVCIIRKKPLHVIGAVALAGLVVGLTGRKMSKAFFPVPGLVAEIIKKLV